MYTTIKRSASNYFTSIIVFLFCISCDKKNDEFNVVSFEVYDRPVKAVVTTNDGYAILSDSAWFLVDSNGVPSNYHLISVDADDANFYSSDIVYSQGFVYVLAAVFSKTGEYIDLEIIKFNTTGETVGNSRIRITDGYDISELGKMNSAFSIPFALYAKGIALSSSEFVVAFNYVGKKQERWGYALLHIDKSLSLIKKQNYEIHSFYGWIHKLVQLRDGNFVMTRGGIYWYAIDKFDLSLHVNALDFKSFPARGPLTPVLSNIIETSDDKLIMTGHIDLQNNLTSTVSTNYDYWVVIYDSYNGVTEKILYGFNNRMELCFTSYLTKDNSIILAGTRRGINQVTLDLDSQVKISEIDIEGNLLSDYFLIDRGGMEAYNIAINNSNGFKEIVGRKLGFSENDIHTFYYTIKKFKDE